MSVLQTTIPGVDELASLDSFDLAFLVLTGHAVIVTKADKFLAVTKALKDVVLWGPQSKLAAKILQKDWKRKGAGLTTDIIKAFDFRGDIKVSRKKINAAFKKHRDAGKLSKKTRKKLLALLDTATVKAWKHFRTQRKEAEKASQELDSSVTFEAYLAETLSSHIQTFSEAYPQRILHKEVIRLVEIVETNPESRTIDKVALKERIKLIAEHPDNYYKMMSDVNVGRAWHFTGLQMAVDDGVTEYQIMAVYDRRTCPVCKRLDGKHFSVKPAHKAMSQYLEAKGAKQISMFGNFPEVKDIDNISPKQLRAKGLVPPFHGRCRCEIRFLW